MEAGLAVLGWQASACNSGVGGGGGGLSVSRVIRQAAIVAQTVIGPGKKRHHRIYQHSTDSLARVV